MDDAGVLYRAPDGAESQGPVPSVKQRTRIVRLLVWLLSSEFKAGAVGLFLVVFGLSELLRQELSLRSWSETQGTVLDSRTEWLDQKKGSLGAPLRVCVRYRYTVDGKGHESTRITTGEPVLFYGVQEAAAFRKRFPPGGPVRVLCASYAPAEATLIAERGSGPWILLGGGAPCLLLAISLGWRRRRRGEESHPDVDVPFLHWILPWK